ncbi:hypothetical protein D3C86_1504230 [compost metagenome]
MALKARFVRPALQVGGRVETDFVALGEDHEPFVACVIPHNLRVTPVMDARVVHDRVALVRLEAITAIGRDEERLALHAFVLLGHDGDHCADTETGRVIGVDHGAAGFDVTKTVLVFVDCNAVILPMHQVGRGRVVPLGTVPRRVIGVVEVVVVPDAVDQDRALRIIHPVLGGGEMHRGTIRCPVRRTREHG